MGFVGTDSELCPAAWVLLVLTVNCVALLLFFWYWQCILSCCMGFVGSESSLCRAAWVLLVLAVHCVVLLGICL